MPICYLVTLGTVTIIKLLPLIQDLISGQYTFYEPCNTERVARHLKIKNIFPILPFVQENIAFFEGFQKSPACLSDMSSMKTEINLVHWWNNKAGRRGQTINPYPSAFPYGNGMVLHFYQQQESSTTKTVHKVINKGLKTYV